VTSFEAAAFQNPQRLVSATIRRGESLPECAYETKNARIGIRTVLAAVVIASELKSGNPRSQGLELRSVKFVNQLWAAERRFRSVNNLEAHLAGGAGDDAESGFVVACIQVFRLRLHDVHHLLACHFTNFDLVRFFGTGSDIGRFL
jgi:hypothetical protein